MTQERAVLLTEQTLTKIVEHSTMVFVPWTEVTRGVFNSTYRDLGSGGGGSTLTTKFFLIQLVVMPKLLAVVLLEKMLTILQEVQTH